MGKKGKRKRSRRKGKKKGSRRGATHSAGVEGGLGITLYKIATDKVATGASPIDAMKVSGRPMLDKFVDAGTRAGKNAVAWDNAKWLLAGMGLHWAKNKPIVKIVLKPVDQLVKLVAGKRYGL